jgi:hypothetical protein
MYSCVDVIPNRGTPVGDGVAVPGAAVGFGVSVDSNVAVAKNGVGVPAATEGPAVQPVAIIATIAAACVAFHTR